MLSDGLWMIKSRLALCLSCSEIGINALVSSACSSQTLAAKAVGTKLCLPLAKRSLILSLSLICSCSHGVTTFKLTDLFRLNDALTLCPTTSNLPTRPSFCSKTGFATDKLFTLLILLVVFACLGLSLSVSFLPLVSNKTVSLLCRGASAGKILSLALTLTNFSLKHCSDCSDWLRQISTFLFVGLILLSLDLDFFTVKSIGLANSSDC